MVTNYHMVKLVESVRLENNHRIILKMKAAESGMSSGEYIRFLIEKDNNGRYKKQLKSVILCLQLIKTDSICYL